MVPQTRDSLDPSLTMWSKATLAAELQNSKVLHVPGQQLVPSCLQITKLRYDDDDDDDDDDGGDDACFGYNVVWLYM